MSPLLVQILVSILVCYIVGVIAVYVVLCETIDRMPSPGGDPTSDPETLSHGFFVGALAWPLYAIAFVFRVCIGQIVGPPQD